MRRRGTANRSEHAPGSDAIDREGVAERMGVLCRSRVSFVWLLRTIWQTYGPGCWAIASGPIQTNNT